MNSFIFTIAVLLVSLLSNAQNTHTLTGYDNYFDPDTLYITAGDTVEFVSIGYHSATEVDSLDWVNNTANHNGGFYVGFGASTSIMKFAIDLPGTYYNICVPHAAMGMKSIIIVESATAGISKEQKDKTNILYPNPATSAISFEPSSTVKIYDSSGKLVKEITTIDKISNTDITELNPGIYYLITDNFKEKFIIK